MVVAKLPLGPLLAVLLVLALVPVAPAAELVLPDMQGKKHSVREYIGQGKWTVVVVWSADCPVCRRDIHHMGFFHAEHEGRDATVLGLSVDGVEGRAKAVAFVDEHRLDFPNLLGSIDAPEQLSGRPFIGTPTYYVFSPGGKLAAEWVGAMTLDQMENLIERLSKERKSKGG